MKRGFDSAQGSDFDAIKFLKQAADSGSDGVSADVQLEQMLAGGAGAMQLAATAAKGGVATIADLAVNAMLMGQAAMPKANSDPNKISTTPMDFSTLGANMPTKVIPVPRELVEHLMTPEHRQIIMEESGCEVEWEPEDSQVLLRGSAEQIKKAQKQLQRVLVHCNWGRSEEKVTRLLRPRIVESAVVRLSPMNRLPSGSKTLGLTTPVLRVGKDNSNDVIINANMISRSHFILELDPKRGSIYAIDLSTNGTWLNGVRLPKKDSGKVLVSHGDEINLQDPAIDEEFGYIVNIQELNVKEEVKLSAPRRLMTAEEAISHFPAD